MIDHSMQIAQKRQDECIQGAYYIGSQPTEGQSPQTSHPRLIIVLGALLLFGLTNLAGCIGTAPVTPPAPPTEVAHPVRVGSVTKGTIARADTYSGNIQTKSQVNVLPKSGGRIEKLNVEVGQVVKAGDVIAELDFALQKTSISQAEAALAGAQAKLGMIEDGPKAAQVAQAEANARAASERVESIRTAGRVENVAQAEANLAGAKARLEQLKKGATPEQVKAAQLSVEQARNGLYTAQVSRDGVCGNSNAPKFQCDAGNGQVNVAETAWRQAEAQLAVIKAPPTAEQIAQAQSAIDAAAQQVLLAKSPVNQHDLAQAQAAAEAAQQSVVLASQPFSANDKKAAQAGVDQANAGLEAAKLQLKDTSILAPFDGVVSVRYLAQGAMAGPTTPIIALIASDVEIVVNVEEARISRLEVGRGAIVTVAAYPGEQFPATVVSRAPMLDQRNRTLAVRFRPNAAFDNPPGNSTGKLLDGMFAQVSVGEAGSRESLQVPKASVILRDGVQVVIVVKDGVAKVRPVTIGTSDTQNSEILSGVQVGEEVIITGQENITDGAQVSIKS